MRLALLATLESTGSSAAPDLGPEPGSHWLRDSLPSHLNAEWRSLCDAPATGAVVGGWASVRPALAGLDTLAGLLRRITDGTPAGRDAVLLALLELSRDGDRLAGRVVLQAMLPKAVRVAMSIVRRPDVLGDRDEAQARAVAALWQAIATYPLTARPGRVSGNLALDTLALVQRGHTGSSHFASAFPEQPFADLHLLEAGRHDVGSDELAGPADAELLVLLAWAVRTGVLKMHEARLLTRTYLLDGPAAHSEAVAAELGIKSGPALRQRCSRLARRLGQAAVAAGVGPIDRAPGAAFLVAA